MELLLPRESRVCRFLPCERRYIGGGAELLPLEPDTRFPGVKDCSSNSPCRPRRSFILRASDIQGAHSLTSVIPKTLNSVTPKSHQLKVCYIYIKKYIFDLPVCISKWEHFWIWSLNERADGISFTRCHCSAILCDAGYCIYSLSSSYIYFFILLQKITVAECIETQSKAMTMLTVDQLSYLLKFALQKIKQPGVRVDNTRHSSSVGLHPKRSVSTHQRRWNAFWLVHLFSFSCWSDGTFSETSVSGAAPRLCRVHFPPYGPVHAREGNITRPKGPLKHDPPPLV